MATRIKKEEPAKVEHKHLWAVGPNLSEERCSCGAVRLSEQELQRRQEMWNGYYEAVHNSESYLSFLECKKAFQEKNITRVKELAALAHERRMKGQYLEAPHFPRPDTFHYVIAGTVGDGINSADESKNKKEIKTIQEIFI